MKIALACNSLLLTKSLEIFLKKKLTSYKKCDFVISDKKIDIDKPLFVISDESSNLQVPFCESSLMIKLDKFYTSLTSDKEISNDNSKELADEVVEKIDFLTKKFRDDLIEVISEYYEKK